MLNIAPCLWFDGDAEEAAALYATVIPESSVKRTTRFGEVGQEVHGGAPGEVLTVDVVLGGQPFLLLNGGPGHPMNPSISFYVYADDADDARRIFDALGEGGEALMPFDAYPWNPAYGWVQDRFGASWQVMAGVPDDATRRVLPCLLFSGDHLGEAQAALERYAAVFEDAAIVASVPYEPEEHMPVHAIKHGHASLAGYDLIAMDGPADPSVAFNDAISLQITCESQDEVDRYWDGLLEGGGEPVACGWLTDAHGVSWQVTPRVLEDLLADPDREKADRVMAVMMDMVKIEIAALEKAADGTGGG